MEKYDLQPIEENITNSLVNNIVGRNGYIYNLLRLLNNQQGPWTVAIDADWGSGKTFFVKQCKAVLDACYQNNEPKIIKAVTGGNADKKSEISRIKYRTVYYDAWEEDDADDPILSLLNSIVSSDWSSTVKESLIKIVGIAEDLISISGPIQTNGLLKKLLAKDTQSKEEIENSFYKALTKLVPENGRLVFFIDELDRCKPTYAIKLLERIKHYFQSPQITFVFSVDLNELQNTVKRYYGEQFDGLHYLDRFFDLVIPLPDPDIERYFDNTKDILIVDKLFKTGEKKSWYYDLCKKMIEHFNFSVRQINHFYLKANSASYNYLDQSLNSNELRSSRSYGKFLVCCFFIPLMTAISMDSITEYRNFISGKASESTLKWLSENQELISFINDLRNRDSEDKETISQKILDTYNAIFKNNKTDVFEVANNCLIEDTNYTRRMLINACSLLSDEIKA